jgi:hypothetical protein
VAGEQENNNDAEEGCNLALEIDVADKTIALMVRSTLV